jgi:hypothetical protein
MLELEELMKILRVQARADESYRYAVPQGPGQG